MAYLRVYTREILGEEYPSALANSVHMALQVEGEEEKPLNQNYGILFPKAKICGDNTLEERGVRSPGVFRRGNTYFIVGEQVDGLGQPVRTEENRWIAWETEDFVHFRESAAEADFKEIWERISLPEELIPGIRERWIPLQAVSVSLPERVVLESPEELEKLRGTVTYSDGSVDEKPICWEKASLERLENNSYRIQGRMEAIDTGFPLTVGLADPVIFAWEGKWYFTATNDNRNDIGLYVRCADSVKGLFVEGAEEKCILDYDEARGLCQTFWAPEFHVIGGRLYLLFAVSDQNWGPQCHMMRLKEGGEIMRAEDWEDPIRVRRKDGSYLTEDGITLDMTHFEAGDKNYLVWSYRYGIGSKQDTGSMLYIAATDKESPWQLTSEPVLLSRPLFGWENQSGTINNEGPYPLLLGETIYLAFSGGAACGPAYVVGYLKAKVSDELLDASAWEKEPTAVLHLQSIEGIVGPGHNSFFYDEEGRLMIAYHAQEREKYFCRCSAYHRVHLSKSGFPLLNVAGERDLPEEMAEVSLEFELHEK